MINIEFIHDVLLSNINEKGEETELEILYMKNLFGIYMEYIKNPNDDLKVDYINALDKYSIINLNNDLGLKQLSSVKGISKKNTMVKYCACGGQINISEIECKFICNECGEVRKFTGIISDRVIKPNGKVVSIKNNYKHKTYFDSIYKNIFALEDFKFPQEVKDGMRESLESYCMREGIRKDIVPYRWFRVELDYLGFNIYFPHINLLKKELTEVIPKTY